MNNPGGSFTIDNIEFNLLKSGKHDYAWTRHDLAAPTPISTPEEAILSRHDPGYLRTIGQLDWSAGIGLSQYLPNDRRMSWSQGPSGENLRQIHRAHEVRKVSLGVGGPVTDFFQIGGDTYLINGDYVRRITLTLNAETVSAAQTVSGTGDATGYYLNGRQFTDASPIWYDGTSNKVNIAATGGAIVTFDGTTWINTIAGANYTHWTLGQYRDGVASQRLWGSGADSFGVWVRNLPLGQDPATDTNWSVRFPLGNRIGLINTILALRDGILIATDDGMLYKLEYDPNGGVPFPMTDIQSVSQVIGNGRNMRIWNGIPVYPTKNALYMIAEGDGGQFDFISIGPENMPGSNNPVKGQVTAIASNDPEWIYVSIYNPVDTSNNNQPSSYIYKGRRPLNNEQVSTRIIWQPACQVIKNDKITAMEIFRTGANPVLIMGSEGANLYFVTLPQSGNNALNDPNCRSTVSASYFDLPDHDGLSPNTIKVFKRIRISTKKVSNGEYLNVYYRIDGGGFYLLDTQIRMSPVQEIILPAGVVGRSIGVRLEFVGTDNTIFPTVESVAIDFQSKTDPTSYVDVQVFIERNQIMYSGPNHTDPVNRIAYLARLARDTADVQVTDPWEAGTLPAQLSGDVGVTVRAVAHTDYQNEPGAIVAFRLNLYPDLVQHSPDRWDVDPWTEGTNIGYWGT
jgi:hypothetical protein